jgi:hypothetical protein
MANVFAILAFASVGMAIVFSMMIVHEVSKRGIKINYVLLRLYIIKYISQYEQLTRKETGKAGPLYRPCVVFYGLTLVFAIVFLILR